MSTPKIVRLNAAALYALGMDRPTVEALINSIRVTGNDSAGTTVPELSSQVGGHDEAVQELRQSILVIQMSTDLLESSPVPVQIPVVVDESWKLAPPSYEQAIKEQAPVDESWKLNPVQNHANINQQMEFLATEVRQLAEQVTAITRMMQDDLSVKYDTTQADSQYLLSEVRQIAERQAQVMTTLDEIKQGTML